MAYRALILRAHSARISALSAKSSSLFSPLSNDRLPQPRPLQSNSRKFCVRTAATNRQSWVDSIKNAVAIVGGVVTIIGGAIGIKQFLKFDEPVLSDLPSKPSHSFQPRKEVRELEEKFRNLEKSNPGNVAKTVYITGGPATGKTQLASEYARGFFESNKHNKKLFVGRLSADSYSNFLQSYLQVAHDLSCVKEETEKAISSGIDDFKDELASMRMLSRHVKKALRERPGWLLIIDGLSLDEGLVKELRPFWPQPNDENWGKGCVLLTTQGHTPTGSSIAIMDLRRGMSEKDAVELLTRESGCSDKEGAVELVNSLDRSPLSVAR